MNKQAPKYNFLQAVGPLTAGEKIQPLATKFSPSAAVLAVSAGLWIASDDGIKGCIADAEDKAYLVMDTGAIIRRPMQVYSTYCVVGGSKPDFFRRFGLSDIDRNRLPTGFVVQTAKLDL